VDAFLRKQIVKKVKKHLSKEVVGPKEGFTLKDVQTSLNYCRNRSYTLLHEWMRNGEITTIKIPHRDLMGRNVIRTCYKFVK